MEAYDSGSSDDSGPYWSGTHSNALLTTISLLTNRYSFTVHLYTVHIKNYVAFVEKEKHSVPVTDH